MDLTGGEFVYVKVFNIDVNTGKLISGSEVVSLSGMNNEAFFKKVKTISKGGTVSWTDKKAKTNGKTYSYKVRAFVKDPSADSGMLTGKASKVKKICYIKRPVVTAFRAKSKKKATVTWKKVAKATGYQVQYSVSKKFTNAKAKKIKGIKNTKITLTKLKAKKTYFVRIRTYRKVGKVTYYSAWSKVKKTKVK